MVTNEMSPTSAREQNRRRMIIIGDSAIDYDYAVTHYTPLDLGNEENLAGLTLLAEEAHKYGTKLGVELQHGGLSRTKRLTEAVCGWRRGRRRGVFRNKKTPLSSTGKSWTTSSRVISGRQTA
jgi:2,4-dienoyl-CoA reductase-like NADH-dependent reductase (Old Yellow Enzyme family)